jgi:hypothetical protein
MSTPRERLALLRNTPLGAHGASLSDRPTETTVYLECAIEIADVLVGLQSAINDMANRGVTVSNNLIAKIEEATKQAEESAKESGKLAAESANLARKLNRLTLWIVFAALISAGAAGVQAWTAWYNVHHQQSMVSSPSASAPPPASARKP